jgi:hypothetical protein
MQTHCPICEAACQVPDAQVAASQQCGQCGQTFRLAAALPPRFPPGDEFAPPPPSVVYAPPGSIPAQTSSAEPEAPPDQAVQPAAPERIRVRVDAAEVLRALGPPPPYRPVTPPAKAPPPRFEIAPAPPIELIEAARDVNIRAVGELGPPPPYRPIIQAGAVFARGPAPDLEPWRMAQLTRVRARPGQEPATPAPPDLDERDWSIAREGGRDPRYAPPPWEHFDPDAIPPPLLAGAKLSAKDKLRLLLVRGEVPGPNGDPVALYRVRATWLAAAGAAVVVLFLLAGSLLTWREAVIERFPGAAPAYAALGLFSPPARVSHHAAEDVTPDEAAGENHPADCTAAGAWADSGQTDDRTTACTDTKDRDEVR